MKLLRMQFLALATVLALNITSRAADVTPADSSAVALTKEEARAIAKEDYIYGFPLVDNYRIQYGYFVDTKDPEINANWNKMPQVTRVYQLTDTEAKYTP